MLTCPCHCRCSIDATCCRARAALPVCAARSACAVSTRPATTGVAAAADAGGAVGAASIRTSCVLVGGFETRSAALHSGSYLLWFGERVVLVAPHQTRIVMLQDGAAADQSPVNDLEKLLLEQIDFLQANTSDLGVVLVGVERIAKRLAGT